jgi:hypothetical protein
MLGKTFVDVFGILDVKARCLNKSLVFYFLENGEVVGGGGGKRGSVLGSAYFLTNEVSGVKGLGDGVKVRIE